MDEERAHDLPTCALQDMLHRVHRRERDPWWFASLDPDADPAEQGRFDLPSPRGTAYWATSTLAAMLEAFQDFGAGRLPRSEVAARVCSQTTVPDDAPSAADLTHSQAYVAGVTPDLWTNPDRTWTQQCAAILDGAGWCALHHGIRHDPTVSLRATTLFDEEGAHPPSWPTGGSQQDAWCSEPYDLTDDPSLDSQLAAYGIVIAPDDPALPVTPLEETDLED